MGCEGLICILGLILKCTVRYEEITYFVAIVNHKHALHP